MFVRYVYMFTNGGGQNTWSNVGHIITCQAKMAIWGATSAPSRHGMTLFLANVSFMVIHILLLYDYTSVAVV